MSFAVSRTHESDGYPVEAAEPKLVLIHSSEEPEPVEPVQRRAKNAAEQFGLQLSEIERLPFDLSALEDEGAFVNVDASNFGFFRSVMS